MDVTLLIHDESLLDLISGTLDDLAFIAATQALAPAAAAALERIHLRQVRAGMLATAVEIERAPQCQD